jgi:peroxiredoxin
LVQLDRYYERIARRGVDVFAVSVDSPEVSKRLQETLDAQITFLSDTDGVLLDALEIRHVGAKEGRDIAYPTSILVRADGEVAWVFLGDNVNHRADPEDVLVEIDRLRTGA